MGLHEALLENERWVWRWYTAYNQRRGRAHALLVPYVRRQYINVPSWYYNTRDIQEYTEREERLGPVYLYPSYIYDDALRNGEIRRACNREQEARYWEIHTTQRNWRERWAMPRHGTCETCFNYVSGLHYSHYLEPEGVIRQGDTGIGGYGHSTRDFIAYHRGVPNTET